MKGSSEFCNPTLTAVEPTNDDVLGILVLLWFVVCSVTALPLALADDGVETISIRRNPAAEPLAMDKLDPVGEGARRIASHTTSGAHLDRNPSPVVSSLITSQTSSLSTRTVYVVSVLVLIRPKSVPNHGHWQTDLQKEKECSTKSCPAKRSAELERNSRMYQDPGRQPNDEATALTTKPEPVIGSDCTMRVTSRTHSNDVVCAGGRSTIEQICVDIAVAIVILAIDFLLGAFQAPHNFRQWWIRRNDHRRRRDAPNGRIGDGGEQSRTVTMPRNTRLRILTFGKVLNTANTESAAQRGNDIQLYQVQNRFDVVATASENLVQGYAANDTFELGLVTLSPENLAADSGSIYGGDSNEITHDFEAIEEHGTVGPSLKMEDQIQSKVDVRSAPKRIQKSSDVPETVAEAPSGEDGSNEASGHPSLDNGQQKANVPEHSGILCVFSKALTWIPWSLWSAQEALDEQHGREC